MIAIDEFVFSVRHSIAVRTAIEWRTLYVLFFFYAIPYIFCEAPDIYKSSTYFFSDVSPRTGLSHFFSIRLSNTEKWRPDAVAV